MTMQLPEFILFFMPYTSIVCTYTIANNYALLHSYKKDIEKSRRDRIDARKELEEYWQQTLKRKQMNDSNEKTLRPSLLQDQCKKYMRCHQCQRKIENIGRSNVMSESRYAAGARLMI